VGNGGGLAENNVVFAYKNIESTIKFTLNNKKDKLTVKQQEVLNLILNSLPQEYFPRNRNQNRFQLEFKSNDFFPHNRFAFTYNFIGAPIYINKDYLYYSSQGKVVPMSIFQATSMLVHEFGHHHKIENENWLDNLGVLVAQSFYQNEQVKRLPWHTNIQSRMIKFNSPETQETFDLLMLTDGLVYINYSKLIKESFKCQGNRVLKGISLYQDYWSVERPFYYQVDLALHCMNLNNEELEIQIGSALQIIPDLVYDRDGVKRFQHINYRVITCEQFPSRCQQKRIEYFNQMSNRSLQ